MGDKCGTRAPGVLAMGLIVLVPLLAGLGSRLNASTTLFLPPTAYDSGGQFAVSVAVGDLDRDGHPDLVTANELSSNVSVLLNEGDGTFRPGVGYGAGGLFSQGVATADVDNDGKPDVLVAVRCRNDGDCSGLAGVLLGNGDGTLRPAVLYPSGGVAAWSIAAADVDRDGNADLLVANESSDTVGVLVGNGDGTFQRAVTYGSGGGSPRFVAAADVNRDGNPDLAVANRCGVFAGCSANGGVGVLLGNGDGSFQPAVGYAGGIGPSSVVVADVTRDGQPDIVAAHPCNGNDCGVGSASVLVGHGDGTFDAATTYSAKGLGTRSVAVGDVNGDTTPDLLAINLCAAPCAQGAVAVLLGNGDGTFQSALIFPSGAFGGESVAIADVTGDGTLDVLVANQTCPATDCTNGSVGVLLNDTSVVRVRIDIDPGKLHNRVNAHSNELIAVALLATDLFDPLTVDRSTVRFGPAGAQADNSRDQDVDRDGRLDIVFYFKGRQAGVTCGDASAALVGATFGGEKFEGTDSVEVLGCSVATTAVALGALSCELGGATGRCCPG